MTLASCIVVNDASCLIDLHKGRLLHVMLKLPYHFIVPLPIRESELLDFIESDWRLLETEGLKTFDLPPKQVAEAFAVKNVYPGLSANDCFCLVTTRNHRKSILLTGDALLKKVAGDEGLEVHGVLWMIDQLKAKRICSNKILISALELWKIDQSVFLPDLEIEKRLRILRRGVE